MSKSLGNLIMVGDLLNDWSPDALRLYLASHHYRDAWSHNPEELEKAARLARRLHDAVVTKGGELPALEARPYSEGFVKAMDADLDTRTAIDELEGLARAIVEAAEEGRDVRAAQQTLRSMSAVFGLRLDASAADEEATSRWRHYLQDFA